MSIEDAKKVEGYVPEAYEIGADYANHTKDVTPGQTPDAKPVDAKDKHKEKISVKDVNEWSTQESTIDKYKQRYKEEWSTKLKEVVAKMMEKL